jgi:hypothetical protein
LVTVTDRVSGHSASGTLEFEVIEAAEGTEDVEGIGEDRRSSPGA